jgi:hypothetical protein
MSYASTSNALDILSVICIALWVFVAIGRTFELFTQITGTQSNNCKSKKDSGKFKILEKEDGTFSLHKHLVGYKFHWVGDFKTREEVENKIKSLSIKNIEYK